MSTLPSLRLAGGLRKSMVPSLLIALVDSSVNSRSSCRRVRTHHLLMGWIIEVRIPLPRPIVVCDQRPREFLELDMANFDVTLVLSLTLSANFADLRGL